MTKAEVQALVRDAVAAVLGPAVPADEPLMASGLDSLGAVELRNALEGRLGGGLALPPTLVFDYPSAGAIGDFIAAQVGARDGAAPAAGAAAGTPALPRAAPGGGAPPPGALVAITGAAGRSPGGAIGRAAAADAIAPVPLARWDWEHLAAGAAAAAAAAAGGDPERPARFGGWLAGVELFDAALFGISAAEAELMDAQQRLLLEASYEAIAAAGAGAAAPPGGALPPDACVAVGIASAEYNNWVLRRAGQPPSAYGATGGALSVASGRLAFVFGLRGAALSVDTACSSSLVAAHFAAGQIARGAARGGLAAGAGLILSPEPTAMFKMAGARALRGACGARRQLRTC